LGGCAVDPLLTIHERDMATLERKALVQAVSVRQLAPESHSQSVERQEARYA
jgi:hypothetical protein